MFLLFSALLAGCNGSTASLPPAPADTSTPTLAEYKIGQGDMIDVAVWRSPELSASVPVRPDGKISTPLVGETLAAGLTSTQLADSIKQKLRPYAGDPVVSVIVTRYSDPLFGQVRAIGEVGRPAAVPYRDNMTLLDILISVGGMTRFASGNAAVLVRETAAGPKKSYSVRLDDLVKRGDMSANVAVLPGDVIIVPRGVF
jgi:polysaccharide export outer membrane protein